MQKPALLRAIYAELRSELGSEAAAGDVLRLAHAILLFLTDDEDLTGFGQPPPSRSFVSMPVDEAMSDGGWRVLEFELGYQASIDNVGARDFNVLRSLIEKYLGPEWQHQTLTGQL
tara:strand:- start:2466 stop:2813 length:348 start_codon:yes stop_codon:yes gene_type:complete